MDQFNNFTIISWNIRGAMGSSIRRHVRDIVSVHHPSLFFVYETHGAFQNVENFWSSIGYKPIYIQEARGFSGEIWVLSYLDDICFSLVDSIFQAITFSVSKGNSTWYVSAIYASPVFSIRSDFWSHLSMLRNQILDPWVVIGDFNEVVNSNEVSGGSFCCSHAQLFSSMITDCSFLDMNAVGGWFT